MELLVIRHAIAADRDEGSFPDSERPLTEKGRERMVEVAAALNELVPELDVIATSPLLRARETAAVVARHYDMKPQLVDELAPGAPLGRLLEWLAGQVAARVAVVGHEPGLSTFASWLISSRPESHLVLKKGGACLLQFSGKIEAGMGTLAWLMTPKQLRRMV
jgi:phosphohistidine phosphatase